MAGISDRKAPWRRSIRVWLLAPPLLLAAGCAGYEASPLPDRSDLAGALPAGAPAVALYELPEFPELRGFAYDPEDGLDPKETALVAIANNPELRVARAELDVTRAQLYAAGLLPDPQAGLAGDHPTSGAPPLFDAFNIGLSYDIQSLITHGAAVSAAEADLRNSELAYVWKVGQVAQQARLLFVKRWREERLRSLLGDYLDRVGQRYANARSALAAGDVTIEIASAALTALMDAQTKMRELERETVQTRHDLNLVLGLAPETEVPLTPALDVRPVEPPAGSESVLAILAKRPDLMALQAGYESQEERLWKAVLAQFPNFSVGITRARDTSAVYTTGVGITLTLPVLNANQGNIAIEKATRGRLRAEYQLRLDQGLNQIAQLLQERDLLARQRRAIDDLVPELEAMTAQARAAYDQQNIDPLIYFNLENTLLTKKTEALSIEESLANTDIALRTLLWRIGNE